jgi:sugar-phosphatase
MQLRVRGSDDIRILPCDAILFDMDGTLVDSTACVVSTWRAWATRHGIEPEAVLAVSHGRQNGEVLRLVAPHLDTPEEHARMERDEEACRDGIVAVPGATEILAALPPDCWAVVTSAWRRLAEIRMGCASLPLPEVLITSDLIPQSKPDPAGYLAAAEALGIEPARCVVIEDAPAGIEAGQAAGMTVIGVATTFPRDRLDCELVIPDLRALAI